MTNLSDNFVRLSFVRGIAASLGAAPSAEELRFNRVHITRFNTPSGRAECSLWRVDGGFVGCFNIQGQPSIPWALSSDNPGQNPNVSTVTECVEAEKKVVTVSSDTRMSETSVREIPEELKRGRVWVLHKKKVPFTPEGRNAKTNQPQDFSMFDNVLATFETSAGDYDGIGRVVVSPDYEAGVIPLAVIDLDHVIINGELLPEAQEIIEQFPNAYIEYSPSGRGLHIWTRGRFIKGHGCKYPLGTDGAKIELYDEANNHFFTVTGAIWQGHSSISPKDTSGTLNALYMQFFQAKSKQPAKNGAAGKAKKTPRGTAKIAQAESSSGEYETPERLDGDIIRVAKSSKHGDIFKTLFDSGDWKKAGFYSMSEARFSLLGRLAFFSSRNGEQIRRIFQRSKLYQLNTEKCNRVLDDEITKVISNCADVYEGPKHGPDDTCVSSRRWREISKQLDIDSRSVLIELFLGAVREHTSTGVAIFPHLPEVLAHDTGMSIKRVRRALKALCTDGYIYLNRQGEFLNAELWRHHLRVTNDSYINGVKKYFDKILPKASKDFCVEISRLLTEKTCQNSRFNLLKATITSYVGVAVARDTAQDCADWHT